MERPIAPDLDALIRQYVLDLAAYMTLRDELPVAVVLADLLMRAGLEVPDAIAGATV